MKNISSINKWLMESLFPSYCIGCQTFGAAVCSLCLATIKIERGFSNDSQLLYACRYHDPLVKKIIHQFKYQGMLEFREAIGVIMEKFLLINGIRINSDWLVVPIPLHWIRQNERTFNQSALIGRWLATRLNLQFAEPLIKIRKTESQTNLTGPERSSNLAAAFECPPIPGAKILLIDDICTTGSTFKECSRILTESGAAKIKMFAFAKD